jgi:hypothetical protein
LIGFTPIQPKVKRFTPMRNKETKVKRERKGKEKRGEERKGEERRGEYRNEENRIEERSPFDIYVLEEMDRKR